MIEQFMAAAKPKPAPAESICPPPPPVRMASLGAQALYAHSGVLLDLSVKGQNISLVA